MQHMSRTALDLEQRRSPTVRLGGSGTAHEIAAAAALLLSDDASYITRRVLGVAGGWGAGEFGGDGVQFGAAVTVCGPVLASGLVDGGGDEVAVVRATRKWSPSTSPMTMRAVSVQNHREFLCGYEALLHCLRRDQRLRRCADMHRSPDRPGPL
jgi:hypothetical protein